MKRPWQTLSKKVVHENPYWKVRGDKVIKPSGSHGEYYFVQQNDYVLVVPITKNKKYTYLVRLWRYTIEKNSWEFPAGYIDKGETALQAAKRELFEETGLTAKKWKKFKHCQVDHGLTNKGFYIFFAEDLTVGTASLEEGEIDMITKKFSLRQVEQMIDEKKVFESPMVTAFYFLKKYLNL